MLTHIMPYAQPSVRLALSSCVIIELPMDPAHVEQQGPPRVTALIISRNSAFQLQLCLEALERSEDRTWLEVLVVDNGSSDGSADVAANFAEVQVMRLPKDFGRTKASNIGMRTAKGDFILFLPPNVEVQPDTIVRLRDRLAMSDSIGAVCPYVERWYRLPDPDSLKTACATGQLPHPQSVPPDAAEVSVDYAPDAPMLARRLFLRGMNYFDEHFGEYWPDLDLCRQLRNAGKSILVLPDVRVSYGPRPAQEYDSAHVADCVLGAAAYVGKQFGSGAGIKLRLAAALSALVRGQFSQVSALVSGQKVDGTHI